MLMLRHNSESALIYGDIMLGDKSGQVGNIIPTFRRSTVSNLPAILSKSKPFVIYGLSKLSRNCLVYASIFSYQGYYTWTTTPPIWNAYQHSCVYLYRNINQPMTFVLFSSDSYLFAFILNNKEGRAEWLFTALRRENYSCHCFMWLLLSSSSGLYSSSGFCPWWRFRCTMKKTSLSISAVPINPHELSWFQAQSCIWRWTSWKHYPYGERLSVGARFQTHPIITVLNRHSIFWMRTFYNCTYPVDEQNLS